ncbi:hypothetical protein Nmel_010270 [Mimus melanotis]
MEAASYLERIEKENKTGADAVWWRGPLRGGHNLFSCGSKCLDIPDVHVTPSGDRGATTRMFSASKTHLPLSAVEPLEVNNSTAYFLAAVLMVRPQNPIPIHLAN